MKYYALFNSLDRKMMGKIPQVKDVIHHCHVTENPLFIDRFPFIKIETNPILSNVILYNQSKQTDLIQSGGQGFSHGSILISKKLKQLLENFNFYGIQFFSTYIIQKGTIYNNYWQTHVYEMPYEFVDFNDTDILLKERDADRRITETYLKVNSTLDFLNMAEKAKYPKFLFLKNISFVEKMNLDYFFLRNIQGTAGGIVSSRLKAEMEKHEITGVEFRPIECSLNDWFGSNGLREKTYGK